ncbi:50S ribosomal protein L29 [candidate division KSB1 bacterium]|nr:50S ribosomal protein L29 [candidate division KSB1 bacterium]NIR70235.1 50S ribosomal protein L29 [candidate division KSB1 bacterium]NIS26506.1 50S ribosomal protein L29 [candidate division KSB1 bacterium]NIT73268.1 50S ribosomal protein L29 [candidate division KSB1 bacterium]NIU23892.1 50S ribosomal protein L29 [candidate division KSB1 bacterium]
MKAYELRELTQSEIEIRLADSLEELYNLRFQHAMHQLENPLRVKEVKRDIARFKTALREFELGIRTEEE